jgi:hypothetical protein
MPEEPLSNEELRRRYHTNIEDLPPELQEPLRKLMAAAARNRATGKVAPPRRAGDNFAIGLDDNLEPFPVDRDKQQPPQ